MWTVVASRSPRTHGVHNLDENNSSHGILNVGQSQRTHAFVRLRQRIPLLIEGFDLDKIVGASVAREL